MKNHPYTLANLLLVLSLWIVCNASAESVTVSGKILGEQAQPIAAATVSVGSVAQSSDDSGNYSINATSSDIYRLNISAPGYFSFIQTFSRADLSENNVARAILTVPPIVLVERKDNRHLFVFAGDTMMGRRFVEPPEGEPALIRPANEAQDIRAILQHVKPYLDLADFASVNLETQLSDSPLTDALPKSVTFYTTPEIASALRWAGVDYVALGNNHTFDYLDVGLTRTLDALRDSGVAFSGAGVNDIQARRPYTTSVAQQRVDLLSYVGWAGNFQPNQVANANKGGAALGTETSIAADLSQLPADSLSIVQYHSGLEYVSKAPLAEETQLKLAIDRGADLALGHHSHVLQGFEIYKGKLIGYSLGNFVFDQYLYSTHSGMLLYVWFDGDQFHRAEIVPIHINGYVPTPATGSIRFDILQRLARLSDSTSTCMSRSGGHAIVQACSPDIAPAIGQILTNFEYGDQKLTFPRRLSRHDVDPIRPIRAVESSAPFRVGLDILRRGDFEYSGLFGTQDRTWIDDARVSVVGRDSMVMEIDLGPGDTATTGMKVFARVFTRSNPATVAGIVKSTGCAKLRFSLQRRPDGMSFTDALTDGPIGGIGEYIASGEWSEFAADFQLPRTFTRSIRLLIDVENCEASETNITVTLDDLALIEWQTPWLPASSSIPKSEELQSTHIVFRP